MLRSKSAKTLLEFLEFIPPVAVRSMAVKTRQSRRVQRRLVAELTKLSGIPRRSFIRLSYLVSWETVPIGVASRFAAACGVRIWDENPAGKHIRRFGRYKLSYLRKHQREAMDKAVKALKKAKP